MNFVSPRSWILDSYGPHQMIPRHFLQFWCNSLVSPVEVEAVWCLMRQLSVLQDITLGTRFLIISSRSIVSITSMFGETPNQRPRRLLGHVFVKSVQAQHWSLSALLQWRPWSFHAVVRDQIRNDDSSIVIFLYVVAFAVKRFWGLPFSSGDSDETSSGSKMRIFCATFVR